MFETLKTKLHDTRTLSRLFTAAEAIARAQGKKEPGSEHFVLAALELPDGSAQVAFACLGLDRETFAQALQGQFADALRSVGLKVAPDAAPLPHDAPPSTLYSAAPSGQTLVQRLAHSAERKKSRPLLGADVLLMAAEEEFSVAARAFARLGVTREQLADAAQQAIAKEAARAA